MTLKPWILAAMLTFAALAPAGATGLYTCDLGPGYYSGQTAAFFGT